MLQLSGSWLPVPGLSNPNTCHGVSSISTLHIYNINTTLDQHYCDGDSTCTWDITFNAAFILKSVTLAEDANTDEFTARLDARICTDTAASINVQDVSILNMQPLVINLACSAKLETAADDAGKYPDEYAVVFRAVDQLHKHLATHVADMQPVPAFPTPVRSEIVMYCVEKFMKTFLEMNTQYGDGACTFTKSSTRRSQRASHMDALVPVELECVDVLGKHIKLEEVGRTQDCIRYVANHGSLAELLRIQLTASESTSLRDFSRIILNTFRCFVIIEILTILKKMFKYSNQNE